MKKIVLVALTAALLLRMPVTALAVEENVVIALPAVEPVASPSATRAPYYGPDTLLGYYGDDGGTFVDEQSPSLTADEQQRAKALLSEYNQGARPSQPLLNVTGNVAVGVYALNPEEYDGESVYVLLPGEPLTNDQLLGIMDAYAQLGLAFQPDGLNYRNCARGGGIDGTRFLLPDELKRKALLEKLYRRQELRPDRLLTPLPGDDGTGFVTVDSKIYAGLDVFQFIPYRKLSDEELLAFVAFQIKDAVSSSQYARCERQARSELKRLMQAPLALELQNESMNTGYRQSPAPDDRPVYSASFRVLAADSPYSAYHVKVDAETGVCEWLYAEMDVAGMAHSDVKPDPAEARWVELARRFVEAARGDAVKVGRVEALGVDERPDIGACVHVRVTMEDGGYYDLLIAPQNSQVIDVEYVYQPTDASADGKR